MNNLPPGHICFKFDFETTLELVDGVDTPVDVVGFANLFTDPCWGADADGNRGEIKSEISEVVLVEVWGHFPDRPQVLLAKGDDVERFLFGKEIDGLIEQACEDIFKKTKNPWDWEEDR